MNCQTHVNKDQNRPEGSHGSASAKPAGFQGFQYTSGAFQAPRSVTAPAPVKPAAPPKQPRGRLFVVSLVVAVLAFGGHKAYEALLRYSAYGVVAGRSIEVPATVDGLVKFVHVEEGETVRQGQLLLTLHSPDLLRRVERLDDDLRVAQAKLQAAMSRLKWELSEREQKVEESVGEFYEKWGQARLEQARLLDLQQTLKRTEELFARKAAAAQDVQKARLDEQGQREKLEQIQSSLKAWKKRAEAARDGNVSRRDELLPMLAEIESLESEQCRLRADQDRQEIRSPVNGIVARRHRFTGEGAAYLQPLFTIVEEDSLHVELFVPQDKISNFQIGDRIEVQLAPFWDRVPCRVARFGDEQLSPPAQIERYYPTRSLQVPIHLEPDSDFLRHRLIQVGAVVKLPQAMPRWIVAPDNSVVPTVVPATPTTPATTAPLATATSTPTVALVPDPTARFH